MPPSSCSPAAPSSTAFKAAFITRTAVGELRAISRHHPTVVASKSSNGTTAFTSPMSRASVALYKRAKNQISRALRWPTRRAKADAP